MIEILQIAGSLGVGAFLGTLIFFMYRQDRKASEKRLTRLLEEDQETRREHTEAIIELITLVKRINGKHGG